jgi:dTDP-4-dehydrorhamnose 3,5-epimerase
MQVERLAIPEVMLVTPRRFSDSRGFFAETWNRAAMARAGIDVDFVQDNHSYSAARGVVRGLHCQIGTNAQGKLVRCLKGAIWDVVVDIRHGSPTFGQHAAAVLSAENFTQLWVPAGFLHGFCTLTPDAEVAYKVDAPYDRAAERGVIWSDPDLALPWPVGADEVKLSDKDAVLPRLSECDAWFSV